MPDVWTLDRSLIDRPLKAVSTLFDDFALCGAVCRPTKHNWNVRNEKDQVEQVKLASPYRGRHDRTNDGRTASRLAR